MFRVYKSQLPVIEHAIGTAGSDTRFGQISCRYSLEMICAVFPAGAG